MMGTLKVVLLTDTDSMNQDRTLPSKYHGVKLWETVRSVVEELQFRCESVDLHKLDFQEHESVNKFLNADIVLMVFMSSFFFKSEYWICLTTENMFFFRRF